MQHDTGAGGSVRELHNVLEVTDVSKRFPGVTALDRVSFTLRPGEIHAIVGENGAGKSTLIKVMTGVYALDGGEVRYHGHQVAFRTPLEAQAAGISTIYQEINLVPLLSVARNLFLGREPRKLGLVRVAEMNARAHAILTDFGLDIDVKRPLRSLGLGAQQMVAIARAVQLEARVVIMDEPTSSLEKREVETLFRVARRLQSDGIAIIYVTHRLEELYEICDRVTVLRDGKVVAVEPMKSLDRLRLVSLMLGRDMSSVRHDGATALSGDNDVDAEKLLSVRNLTRRHRLHDISFDVHRGEVVGLGGLLGAGRSETAKAIFGALSVDGGTVEVDGIVERHRSTSRAIKDGVVMLPGDRTAEGIIPNLSVRENIILAAMSRLSRFGLVSDAKEREIVEYFMSRLRIKASSPEQKVGELSGGNQQKVLLARLLCLNPKVLLLDEPTRGIDIGAKAEVQAVIDELAREGLGVLLISSEVDELIEGSDRIVVLREGKVIGELIGDDVDQDVLTAALAASPPADGVA